MPGRSVRVLLVDARDYARESLARRLGKDRRLRLTGFVATPDDAAHLLRSTRADAVVLDVHGLNGPGALACSRLHQPGLMLAVAREAVDLRRCHDR